MVYDILIIGGGPAGLSAALYARRAGRTALVLEKGAFGGQITYSPKVENIPGFPVLSGNEFADKLVDQVLALGADCEAAEVTRVEERDGIFAAITEDGVFEGRTVIVAAGARHRLLGLAGEEDLIGNGISFCAVCDGAFYTGKKVAVVGGGNSALQEALLLADLAASVTVIQNLDTLTGEVTLQKQLAERENVTVLTGTVVDAYLGEGSLSGVRLKKKDGSTAELALDGLFLAVGLVPQNEPFASLLALDGRGYLTSDERCLTNVRGIFAAGDCRTKAIRQVTTAAADGAVAALAACDYLNSL